MYNSSLQAVAFENYTAIGDSYAAGDGLYPAIPNDPEAQCKRTTSGFPYQFYQKVNAVERFNFPACSGANTSVVIDQIDSGASSYSKPSIGYDFGTPDLVSIIAGGDNSQAFFNVIYYCIGLLTFPPGKGSPEQCNNYISAAKTVIQGIYPQLQALYKDAMTRNLLPKQNRKVYVLSYPEFYNTAVDHDQCNATQVAAGNFAVPTFGPTGVATQINQLIVAANTVIQKAAASTGVTYIDIDQIFTSHRICDAPSSGVWFQTKFTFQTGYAAFHPTTEGYAAMAAAFAAAIA